MLGLSQDEHRFELSRLFGATHLVNLEREDPVEAVLELTDGVLADMVVDLTGATASFPLALDLARPMGVVVVGSNTGEQEVSIVPSKIPIKELRVQGVNTHDTPAVQAAIKIVESRRYPIERMVTHHFALAEAETAVLAAGGEIELGRLYQGRDRTELKGVDMDITWDYTSQREYVRRISEGMPPVTHQRGGDGRASEEREPGSAGDRRGAGRGCCRSFRGRCDDHPYPRQAGGRPDAGVA